MSRRIKSMTKKIRYIAVGLLGLYLLFHLEILLIPLIILLILVIGYAAYLLHKIINDRGGGGDDFWSKCNEFGRYWKKKWSKRV